jgi:hypothetical protein
MSKKDPWTDPDPQPGDFDEYLATVDPGDVEFVDPTGGPKVKTTFIRNEDPDKWVRRQRAKAQRREPTGEVAGRRAKR